MLVQMGSYFHDLGIFGDFDRENVGGVVLDTEATK